MPSLDIRTDVIDEPVFPDRCVGCGRDAPGMRAVRFARGNGGFLDLLPIPIPLPPRFGGPRRIVVPMCRGCFWWDVRRRVVQTTAGLMVTLAVIFGSLAIASLLAPPAARTWVALVFAFPAILIGLSFVILIAPCYEVRRDEHELVHSFRSRWAAARFARANELPLDPYRGVVDDEDESAGESDRA